MDGKCWLEGLRARTLFASQLELATKRFLATAESLEPIHIRNQFFFSAGTNELYTESASTRLSYISRTCYG